MKLKLAIVASFCLSYMGYAQEEKPIEFSKENMLKELSENACKCIDSIPTDIKRDSMTAAMNKCIDDKVGAYMLASKLGNIKDLEAKAKEVDGKKEIDISINFDPSSKEYKEAYYELERHLVDNCPAVKAKLASNDYDTSSQSNNSEAIKFYNLGLKESKNENYAKAAEYYKKATVFDPNFAFAFDNLGITYRRLNEFDKAIEAYEKSLKINPNGMMPLQNIAIAYQFKKEYKKSVKAYERMAKIDPKNPEVFYGIGHIYTVYLNDNEKALDNLCQAYNIYVEQNSPYRTDAEKLINVVYGNLKKEGKEKVFDEILKKHNIKSN